MSRCRYLETQYAVTRGTTCPITMKLNTDEDLTEWTVMFTMRASVADNGDPIVQFDSSDTRMSVDEQTVTVTLTDDDTWRIPEKAVSVFIQLNIENSDGVVYATYVYSLGVGPNIKEVSE